MAQASQADYQGRLIYRWFIDLEDKTVVAWGPSKAHVLEKSQRLRSTRVIRVRPAPPLVKP
jgi:hypothetical protein